MGSQEEPEATALAACSPAWCAVNLPPLLGAQRSLSPSPSPRWHSDATATCLQPAAEAGSSAPPARPAHPRTPPSPPSRSITVPAGRGKRASIGAGYSGDSSCVPEPPGERGIAHRPPSCVTRGDAGPTAPSRPPGALALDVPRPVLPGSDGGHETPIKAASIPLSSPQQAAGALCWG